MDQANPIPFPNTGRPLLNMPNQPQRQPLHPLRPRIASADPQSLPLQRHPKWPFFLADLNEMIMKEAPGLKDSFHALLKRVHLL